MKNKILKLAKSVVYVCKNIQFIPIRKVEIYGSYKTSVIWKKKKDVAETAIGLTTRVFME